MAIADKDLAFHRRLKAEMDFWVNEHIITLSQKDQILARYTMLDAADKKTAPGKLITTISILGALLIGIGIILFVASNWSQIPRWGKLSMIFVSMFLSYGLGYYARYEKGNYPRVGAAAIFLGSMIFGAGIFLIAQIYHITVHYPNGVLLWSIGIFPLAYLLRFKTILSLAITALLVWLGMEASFWVPGFSFGMRLAFVTLYCMAGLVLWMVGLMHRGIGPLRTISSPYAILGLVLAFSGGYILTFDVFREGMGSPELLVFYLPMAGIFLSAFIIYVLTKPAERAWVAESLSLLLIMAILLYLSLSYTGFPHLYRGYREGGVPFLMQSVANLIFAAGIIGVIFLGYTRKSIAYINVGLLFFVLLIIARYFDFFWKLLPRSLFFIAGGLILMLGGIILERKRRQILASFTAGRSES
ncbi:MAG: hypothetical protein A4E58_01021 [Syntrophorhabdus sp. PtaB.Bin006]|nr:MAG: hypothetical protein A4E58_01021 [Syntrophorhabdus sp. PtaB.Bin006]